MVGLVVVGFFIANEVKVGHASYTAVCHFKNLLTLSPKLVNEFGLPVEHNVLLMLNGFFLKRRMEVSESVTMVNDQSAHW